MKVSNIRQMAYVTRPEDFDAALDLWERSLGAGPFFCGDIHLTDQKYRGEATDGTVTVAVTFIGNTQIEIIKPTNDAISPWTEWMATTPEPPAAGLYHHFLIETDDYDQARERLIQVGCSEGFEGRLADGRRVSYVDGRRTFGSYVEVVEWGAASALVAALMQDACKGWDGENPRRSYSDLVVKAQRIVSERTLNQCPTGLPPQSY